MVIFYKILAFIAENFYTKKQRVLRQAGIIRSIKNDIEDYTTQMQFAFTQNGQLILIDKTTDLVLAIIDFKRVGYEANILVNTYTLKFPEVELIKQVIKKHVKGEVDFTDTELAYQADKPAVYVGKMATRYLEFINHEILNKKDKPKLSVVKPEHLN